MIYLILISAFSGAVATLLAQFLLIYWRNPEPISKTVHDVKVTPEDALRDYYFSSHQTEPGRPQQQPPQQEAAAAAAAAASARQQEAAAGGGSSSSGGSPKEHSPTEPGEAQKSETCHFLNAIFLFLFRELRDTPLVRHWLTKKIKVEFEELLLTKTAGRLLEGLSLRDIYLGNALPLFKSARLMKPVLANDDGMPEELNFEVDIEYNGGFHLAIDVELVFGKSAYLFVKMRRVVGRLRLQFTRTPFSHWSFAFLDDPLVDFEARSQFEGRPLPQLTSIIVNQLKRVIKKKHTLPNYKIRYKPFFPFQVQAVGPECDSDLFIQDTRLVEGRLKVTLIKCSRLMILGSYDRETYVHCTLELSSHRWKEKTRSSIKKTEVIKGQCGSVGMTFRHVPASDGDTVHVSIETVVPNSPAAMADLQKGDRLIAIGGVRVTSSVQVPKLLKQAGDRVVVLFERPVRHQMPPFGSLGPLPEAYGQQVETGFVSHPGGYEEDPAPITTLSDISDSRDMDSEFEELIVEPSTAVTNESKDDSLLSVNQSPKRTVTNLASKPLGTISPILTRKLNLVGVQSPLKPLLKESPKPVPHKSVGDAGESLHCPTVPFPPSQSKPPVPPRPQIRLTPASFEANLVESSDSVSSCSVNVSPAMSPVVSALDKSGEKALLTGAAEDKAGTEKMCTKQAEVKQFTRSVESNSDLTSTGSNSSRAEPVKDKTSETDCSTRESLDDLSLWESTESMFRNQTASWLNASVVLEVEGVHKFLNVALWCKDPFKLGGLLCLGHVSLNLEHLALECMATSSAEYQSTFRLGPPEPRANVSRTALRNLSTHKGFNEKLCYGDVTLNFCYLAEGDTEYTGGVPERERDLSLPDDDLREREQILTAPRDDLAYGAMHLVEMRHNFQDTQFQNPIWCEYCKKKVWTKAASQCMVCAYVCHKKCQDKCLAENPFCVAATERRGVDLEAKTTINRATSGITRHIINTSSRLLNLRQVPKTRLVEQVVDGLPGAVEPSPKHTPNTSDNESSDTETYPSGTSPSKQAAGGGGSTKLVRKEGGLDDSVFIAVKEIGRDLYRGLPTDERSQKLELMLDKLQQEIDLELEHNNALLLEERSSTDARRKGLISSALVKSGERLQALTLLMIHYRAGIEDLESVESTSPSEHPGFKGKGEIQEEETLMETEVYDSDICSPVEGQLPDDITEEQICVEALH
ncbi:PDZ domain-containing protein 8 [Nelusetta ayraudi]|uniref:PDZ domain-containing protein 8 n=1 Tax=Nelusetta ayraudi TaxID=303726 RepID=UPI003F700E6B